MEQINQAADTKLAKSVGTVALALIGGGLLTLMIETNSQLAQTSSPMFASWVAHGVGAAVALVMMWLVLQRSKTPRQSEENQAHTSQTAKVPIWFYLGGIPGAFTVILAATAINGGLTLSATISLGLVGQIVFGMVADHFGLLRTRQRQIGGSDLLIVALVLLGSVLILFG